jgi:aspartate aminotransferase-like enzyme
MNKTPKLFSPGPTPLSQEVLNELGALPLHHRSEAFKEIIKEAYALFPILFDESFSVALTSTGTGGLEASVVNFMDYKDHVLALSAGKFGERWGKICKAYGLSYQNFVTPWGQKPNLENLKKMIQVHPPSVFCIQACETSTGTYFDLKAIKELLPEDCLFVVDGITAVGAYPLSMRENGIDVLISGSQKALGLPVGLSLIGFSERAKKRAETSGLPKFYFDVMVELKNLEAGTTTWSTPTQIWQALLVELKKLSAPGALEKKFELNKKAQSLILDWVKDSVFELFSESPSPSLTALIAPPGLSTKVIQKRLIGEGYFVGTGQGSFKDKLIRIGHMANVDLDDLAALLSLLKKISEEEFKKGH